MRNPFTYEQFLWIFEHDELFNFNETLFYFNDDPEDDGHWIGCLRQYEKPYWVGGCDIPDGADFQTAAEMFEAKIFKGRSIKDRWEHIVFDCIGQISVDGWIDIYQDRF